MFRFENNIFLYFISIIPIFYFFYFIFSKRAEKRLKNYGDTTLLVRLFNEKSKYKNIVKFSLLMASLLFVLLGLANPQIGTKVSEAKRKGIDVIVAMDISNSMMSEDVKPNRLERAKRVVSLMIDKMESDRIGLIAFAGDAFIQLPLTTDYSAAKMFLSLLEPDLIPQQGTAIGKAIDLAINKFKTDDKIKKSIIIISDGENHEDDAVGMASQALKEGFIVHTIGMGTLGGGPIPNYVNGQNAGFLKDDQGNVVSTKLNPQMLQQISNTGGGEFILAGDSDPDLSKMMDKLSSMDKKEFKSQLITDYEDRYQYVFLVVLILLIAEFLISERRNKYFSLLTRFVENKGSAS